MRVVKSKLSMYIMMFLCVVIYPVAAELEKSEDDLCRTIPSVVLNPHTQRTSISGFLNLLQTSNFDEKQDLLQCLTLLESNYIDAYYNKDRKINVYNTTKLIEYLHVLQAWIRNTELSVFTCNWSNSSVSTWGKLQCATKFTELNFLEVKRIGSDEFEQIPASEVHIPYTGVTIELYAKCNLEKVSLDWNLKNALNIAAGIFSYGIQSDLSVDSVVCELIQSHLPKQYKSCQKFDKVMRDQYARKVITMEDVLYYYTEYLSGESSYLHKNLQIPLKQDVSRLYGLYYASHRTLGDIVLSGVLHPRVVPHTVSRKCYHAVNALLVRKYEPNSLLTNINTNDPHSQYNFCIEKFNRKYLAPVYAAYDQKDSEAAIDATLEYMTEFLLWLRGWSNWDYVDGSLSEDNDVCRYELTLNIQPSGGYVGESLLDLIGCDPQHSIEWVPDIYPMIHNPCKLNIPKTVSSKEAKEYIIHCQTIHKRISGLSAADRMEVWSSFFTGSLTDFDASGIPLFSSKIFYSMLEYDHPYMLFIDNVIRPYRLTYEESLPHARRQRRYKRSLALTIRDMYNRYHNVSHLPPMQLNEVTTSPMSHVCSSVYLPVTASRKYNFSSQNGYRYPYDPESNQAVCFERLEQHAYERDSIYGVAPFVQTIITWFGKGYNFEDAIWVQRGCNQLWTSESALKPIIFGARGVDYRECNINQVYEPLRLPNNFDHTALFQNWNNAIGYPYHHSDFLTLISSVVAGYYRTSLQSVEEELYPQFQSHKNLHKVVDEVAKALLTNRALISTQGMEYRFQVFDNSYSLIDWILGVPNIGLTLPEPTTTTSTTTTTKKPTTTTTKPTTKPTTTTTKKSTTVKRLDDVTTTEPTTTEPTTPSTVTTTTTPEPTTTTKPTTTKPTTTEPTTTPTTTPSTTTSPTTKPTTTTTKPSTTTKPTTTTTEKRCRRGCYLEDGVCVCPAPPGPGPRPRPKVAMSVTMMSPLLFLIMRCVVVAVL